MNIKELKDQGLILMECISGSKAYGLDIPESDTDIKGVFLYPKDKFYGLSYVPQVSNPTNDIVYYELGRFIDLLKKNNPNILELLATPEDKIIYKHPILDRIKSEMFLSKRCKDSFAGYAFTQIKKARGLNKKIVNPIEKKKKSILEFCYVLTEYGTLSLKEWLISEGKNQNYCGLVNVPNAKNMYALFYDEKNTKGYNGIMKKEISTTVLLSSIPKGERVKVYLSFNQDGYIKYCKDYSEYWKWVSNRNENRYQTNLQHGKNYDSKNMMHTFRLLDMAIEILEKGKVIVKRPNRNELLSIRNGVMDYDDLILKAEMKMKLVEQAFLKSKLPEKPDEQEIEKLIVDLRLELY